MLLTHVLSPTLVRFAGRAPSLRQTWQRAGDLLRQWQRRRSERAELARLGDRELHDFGINRSIASAELRKPFWRD
jgi:uncharacterized protein YjiS (DUF1127 family)